VSQASSLTRCPRTSTTRPCPLHRRESAVSQPWSLGRRGGHCRHHSPSSRHSCNSNRPESRCSDSKRSSFDQQIKTMSSRDCLAVTRRLQKRTSAVSLIADRTAYKVGYSNRRLSGIAVVSMNIYSFTVST